LAGLRPLVLTRPSGPGANRRCDFCIHAGLGLLCSRRARPSWPPRLGGPPPAGSYPALRAWRTTAPAESE